MWGINWRVVSRAEVGSSSHKGCLEEGQRWRGGLNHGGRWCASLRGVGWVQNGYSWLDIIKCNRVSRLFWWLWIYTHARFPLKSRSRRMAKKSLRCKKVEITGPNHVTISSYLRKRSKYPLNIILWLCTSSAGHSWIKRTGKKLYLKLYLVDLFFTHTDVAVRDCVF